MHSGGAYDGAAGSDETVHDVANDINHWGILVKHDRANTDHFKQISFFSACTPKELDLVSRAATQITFAAGQVMAVEGRVGHELIVIVSGSARVTIDGHDIATLTAGESFGEIALLDGGPRTATVTAETDVVAEVIGHRELEALLLDSPHVARSLLVGLARRLRAADVQLTLVS